MSHVLYRGVEHEVAFPVVDGRAKGLWWEPADRGARPRTEAIRFGVLHHQAGEGSALAVYRVLRRRGLSVHFQIDQHGLITQFADVDTVTLHAGAVNGASWGVEIANRGVPPAQKKWPRCHYDDVVHGRERTFLAFYSAQVEAIERLCRAVNGLLGLPLDLPMAESKVARSKMQESEIAKWRGLLGHLHVSSKKIDPSPHLLDDLAVRACLPLG